MTQQDFTSSDLLEGFPEELLEGFPVDPLKRQNTSHVDNNANPKELTEWDKRYIKLAGHIASWSKDTAQVGCVIVNPTLRRVVAFSFNGFPANIPDDVLLLQQRENKKKKLAQIIHAEQNTLLYAGREARGCHAYVVGRPICNSCAILLIQAGIERVVAAPPLPIPEKPNDEWVQRGQLALTLFHKASVGFSPIPQNLLAKVFADYDLDKPTAEEPTPPLAIASACVCR
jgi:dCMP deaminase